MAARLKDSHQSFSRQWVHVACDLCRSDDPELLFEKETFKHVRCRQCGMVYVTPRLREIIKQQETFYDLLIRDPGDFEELVEKEYSRSRKRRLCVEAAEYLPYRTTGHILDIGCGLGGFLRAASEQGWEHPEGIEVVPQIAAYTERYFAVQTQPVEKVHYEANRFDVVRLNNVIEHLASPKAVVRAVHRILRPRGLFAISTPNFDSLSVAICGKDWPYIGGDHHFYLFGPNTLTRLLEYSGFCVMRARTKGVHLTLKGRTFGLATTPLSRLLGRASLLAEKGLDLVVRQTLKGHRLRIWAEKV